MPYRLRTPSEHHGQKRPYTLRAHVSRMAHAARLRGTPADEKAYLLQVSFFGLQAIVQIPNPLAHLIEQAGCVAFVQKMYRQAQDVSTGICRLHYVGVMTSVALNVQTGVTNG